MEQVEKAALLSKLRALNPRYSPADLVIYVDAVAEYKHAQANIDEHGTIVMHPRTGAPIPNPYSEIRDRAGRLIAKHPRIQTGDLWSPPAVAKAGKK